MIGILRHSRTMAAALCVVLVINIVACGTIIHPERRGQSGGRIDPAIAVLDGIGLLFFVIPGLIAYAVDFSTGAIYLPGTAGSASADQDWRVVYVESEDLTAEVIEDVVKRETGVEMRMQDARLQAWEFESHDAMLRELARRNVEYGATAVASR